MTFQELMDCTNARKTGLFYSAVARGCGLELPAQEASATGEFLARTIPMRYSGVYFDNFEDVWRGFNQTERKDLVRWLLDLRHRGFRDHLGSGILEHGQREAVYGCHLPAPAADGIVRHDLDFWRDTFPVPL